MPQHSRESDHIDTIQWNDILDHNSVQSLVSQLCQKKFTHFPVFNQREPPDAGSQDRQEGHLYAGHPLQGSSKGESDPYQPSSPNWASKVNPEGSTSSRATRCLEHSRPGTGRRSTTVSAWSHDRLEAWGGPGAAVARHWLELRGAISSQSNQEGLRDWRRPQMGVCTRFNQGWKIEATWTLVAAPE